LLLDAPTLAALAALGLGAAVVGGIGGFGTGMILTAALAPLIGFKAVVPVLAVAGGIINAGRFWFYRRHFDRRILGIALASALPFLALGAWLYTLLDARTVGTILGVFVILSIPLRRTLQKRQMHLGTPGLAVGEGVFGFASGVASSTGVIQVSLFLAAGLTGPAVLATDALASIVVDTCKALLFQRFDLLSAETALIGIIIGVATIPGSAVAAWLVNRMHAHLHVLFMEALIVVGGASMLWNAWK
jgi:uncharacterized membrane protein YfcA